jgi:DNA repair protein RadC
MGVVRQVRIADLPPSEKPREKASVFGLKSLSDAEVLALIIASGCQGEDALSLSSHLLLRAGGLFPLSGYLESDFKAKGLGKAKKLKIMAAFELGRRAEKEKDFSRPVSSEEECARRFGADLAFLPEEKIRIVCLDFHRRFLREEIIGRGNGFKAEGDYQKALKTAVGASAYYAYLLHNHPSGDPHPSQSDIAATKSLILSFRSLGIILLDHLIVAGSKYYSLRLSQEKNLA